MQNARILILEDDELWVATYRSVLDGKVAEITSVASLEAAIELLDRRYFNVAIVDLVLNNDDHSDTTGMAFLAAAQARGLTGVVAPIMCTAYGSQKSAVAALRDYHVVDFIDKSDFKADDLQAAVAKALEQRHCARRITIELGRGQSLDSLWARKDWAGREDPQELAAELHDLLCRLFPKVDHLWMQPLAAGQSGAGVVAVAPTYGASAGEISIIKFGKRETIQREIDNYADCVDFFVSNQSTTKLDGAVSRVMGAIRYRLIGAGTTRATLAEYYRNPAHSAADVGAVLDNLFEVTCRRWYDNRERPPRYHDLVDLYTTGQRIHWDEVWDAAESCGIAARDGKLEFPGISETYLHPRRWLEARGGNYYCRAWQAITHGDLNEHNVLVTPDRHCWLIDFYRTGKGHILRDFVELETAFKFTLTHLGSFAERKQLEALLLGQTNLRAKLKVETAKPYARAAAAIGHLRVLASEVLGPERDPEEYQVALLLQTLKLLSLKFLDRETRSHALLSAAMICDKLSPP